MAGGVYKRAMATKKKVIPNLAWGAKRVSTRGPKPGLSTKEIADAAISIADKRGLEAVTMQRVAREVGVTTMALYRYFPGKADLLAVMIDSAGGSAYKFGESSMPWKDGLREWARRCAAIYREHAWFLEATTIRRTVMGPNELSWMEAALGMLAQAGLRPREQYYAFLAVIGLVRGHATFEQISSQSKTPWKWAGELTQLLGAEAGKYSALKAVLATEALLVDPKESFEYGLNCILDGIGISKGAA
jgi:AcrR family transcriptional regulator